MIRVTARTRNGELFRIRAEGHALAQQEMQSAPCAAVSALLRGLGLSLLERGDCAVEGSVEREGQYDLSIVRCGDAAWLAGTWGLARAVLQGVAREWPREVEFTIHEE